MGEVHQGIKQHAAAYLVKPITRTQFQHALHAIASTRAAPNTRPVPPAPAELPGHADAPTILLAEDNEESMLMMQDYLTGHGYRVVVARSGSEALAALNEVQPDLILMDIQMPELNGLETIRRIRADTTLATVPIIALTALAMPGDRERCLEAGAYEYLSKPVQLKMLTQIIQHYLQTRHTQGL
jgi:CheY-like chemotaxis protein